jgi:uncharacterized protein with von Willebrand factor type A (vWA) domain
LGGPDGGMGSPGLPDPADVLPGEALLGRVMGLLTAMRRTGMTVSPTATVDAVAALRAIDLGARAEVREALAAVSLTAGSQRPTFDDLFDLFLPARSGRSLSLDEELADLLADADAGTDGTDRAGASEDPVDPAAFLEELVRRLLDGDRDAVRRLAREAVDAFGRLPGAPGSAGEGGWFRYRVLRVVDPTALLDELLARSVRDEEGDAAGSSLADRLRRDELEARVRELVQEIDAEVRRRAAADRDPTSIARASVPAALEELDLLHLNAAQQAEVQARIRPLARRLATRVAVRRRQGHDGALDVRRTVRRALSTGGVPFDPVFRPRRPHRPELFVLCDVSGSVAAFAHFTLLLVHAMQEQFSGVRSFAFVDAIDEVTHLFDGDDTAAAIGRLVVEADVIWSDGHSDYGRSLVDFVERYGRDVTARSTVLVLGDARTNYRSPGVQALERLQRRARHVWWLNPEPRSAWDTGDSVAGSYARYVEEMVEVRNLRQLAAFVEQVA